MSIRILRQYTKLYLFLFGGFALSFYINTQPAIASEQIITEQSLAKEYVSEKDNVSKYDIKSREVMSTIYEINQRMKEMSRKRDIVLNKMMSLESNMRNLAQEVSHYEVKIKSQKKQLSKRLKAIYILGDEGVVRALFSSASTSDLEQTIKFLKLISANDLNLIKDYEFNLKQLNQSKAALDREAKRFLITKNSFNNQEVLLAKQQRQKSKLLNELAEQRRGSLSKLETIRSRAKVFSDDTIFNISFYEQKGKLNPPIRSSVNRYYGMIEHPKFKYKLSHKGIDYNVENKTTVESVHAAKVAFVGNIIGYGQTVILDHGDHYYTVYAKLHKVLVKENDMVKTKESIARVVDEFYFEIRHFSDSVDPSTWLKKS